MAKKNKKKKGVVKKRKRQERQGRKNKKRKVIPKTPKTKDKVLAKAKMAVEKIGKESEIIKRTKIRVIGIGGGAGNIVSEIASKLQAGEQPLKATFVAANTDLQALKTTNRNVIRFQFGEALTHGLGAGTNTELAALAAQKEREKIKKLFLGQDLCILVASLGGGTGSGAAPVFARIAKNIGGVMTLGVFTLPFKFEGEKKMEIARDAILKVKPHLNTISILPNEKIFQVIEKSTPLKEAFSLINKNLAESLQGLIETIYLPGLINIDFADLKTILQGQGRLTFLNTAEVDGANRLPEAIKKVVNCPLYPYTIRGARAVLFNIAGEKQLSLSEVSQISNTISEMANPEAKIIFGISESNRFQGKIKVNLLATGCTAKIFSGEMETTEREISKKKARNKKGGKKSKTKKSSALRKLAKKIRIKIYPKPGEAETYGQDEESKMGDERSSSSPLANARVRKNALQVKRETEELEKELMSKEEAWESPAFLRREQNKSQPEK
jgi:cell division protein FtsZ